MQNTDYPLGIVFTDELTDSLTAEKWISDDELRVFIKGMRPTGHILDGTESRTVFVSEITDFFASNGITVSGELAEYRGDVFRQLLLTILVSRFYKKYRNSRGIIKDYFDIEPEPEPEFFIIDGLVAPNIGIRTFRVGDDGNVQSIGFSPDDIEKVILSPMLLTEGKTSLDQILNQISPTSLRDKVVVLADQELERAGARGSQNTISQPTPPYNTRLRKKEGGETPGEARGQARFVPPVGVRAGSTDNRVPQIGAVSSNSLSLNSQTGSRAALKEGYYNEKVEKYRNLLVEELLERNSFKSAVPGYLKDVGVLRGLAEKLANNRVRARPEVLDEWREKNILQGDETFMDLTPKNVLDEVTGLKAKAKKEATLIIRVFKKTLKSLPKEVPQDHKDIQKILKGNNPISRVLLFNEAYNHLKDTIKPSKEESPKILNDLIKAAYQFRAGSFVDGVYQVINIFICEYTGRFNHNISTVIIPWDL